MTVTVTVDTPDADIDIQEADLDLVEWPLSLANALFWQDAVVTVRKEIGGQYSSLSPPTSEEAQKLVLPPKALNQVLKRADDLASRYNILLQLGEQDTNATPY